MKYITNNPTSLLHSLNYTELGKMLQGVSVIKASEAGRRYRGGLGGTGQILP